MRRFYIWLPAILSLTALVILTVGCDGDDDNPVNPGPTQWHVTAIDTALDTGGHTSIAVDAGGLPHIAYLDRTQDDLNYAYFDGSSWHISPVDPEVFGKGDLSTPTSIRLDSDGNPHIAYVDLEGQGLKYARLQGAVWNITVVDDFGIAGSYPSLALDKNNMPFISYGKVIDTTEGLYVAFIEEDAWTVRLIDTTAPLLYSAAEVDNDGLVHIAYINGSSTFGLRSLRYAVGHDFAWTIDTLATSVQEARFCDLKLTTNGSPRIVVDNYAGQGLSYLVPSGDEWDAEGVGAADDLVDFPRLELDASNRPHLCFLRVDTSPFDYNLFYAVRNGTWMIEIADSLGAVGWYCDLALDASGRPHISHYDFTNQNLKYAVKR